MPLPKKHADRLRARLDEVTNEGTILPEDALRIAAEEMQAYHGLKDNEIAMLTSKVVSSLNEAYGGSLYARDLHGNYVLVRELPALRARVGAAISVLLRMRGLAVDHPKKPKTAGARP